MPISVFTNQSKKLIGTTGARFRDDAATTAAALGSDRPQDHSRRRSSRLAPEPDAASAGHDLDEVAVSTLTCLFRGDPSLHRDILGYIGARPLTDKLVTSGAALVPARQVQLLVIVCFWLFACGVGCIIGGISGATMSSGTFTKRIRLDRAELPFSWLTVWTAGVAMLTLNFLVINTVLWIGPLFRFIFVDCKDKME